MMKKGNLWLAIAVLLLGVSACGKKIPSEVIQPDAMKELLYDYHMASTMGASLPYSENYKKEAYFEYVFRKHHVTKADFDSSMIWYTRHGDVLAGIYDDLQKRLEGEEKAMKALVARRDNQLEVSMSGDTVDIWQDRTLYWLTGSDLTNKITFDLKTDTTFRPFDSMEFTADFHFFSGKSSAVCGICYYFDNDSVQGVTRTIRSSGLQRLYLKPDSAFAIRSVSGFVYYPDGKTDSKGVLINNIRLMRYHNSMPEIVPGDTLDLDKRIRRNDLRP